MYKQWKIVLWRVKLESRIGIVDSIAKQNLNKWFNGIDKNFLGLKSNTIRQNQHYKEGLRVKCGDPDAVI